MPCEYPWRAPCSSDRMRAAFVFVILTGLAAAAGCGTSSPGTYCQTGPKYGTQCYHSVPATGVDPQPAYVPETTTSR